MRCKLMITFFKSQKDFANALIALIDSYWEYETKESEFINSIQELVLKNEEKLYSCGDYTSIVKQRLGKRRIELLNKVLINRGMK